MKAYLDNAATTAIATEVLEVMNDALSNDFGNPSSSHSEGRKSKAKMEQARKEIAKMFNVSGSQIVFTSGGTEANNLAIQSVLKSGEITQVITTDIEHHAVLNTIEKCCVEHDIELRKLKLNSEGEIDLEGLAVLLSSGKKTFVSLMHGNNEIGNLLPIEQVSSLCVEHGAIFHCDTVQTIGHKEFDLQKLKVDFITCSAHKIHGPKGIGFLYVNKDNKLAPLFYGGKQERGFRPGTENIASILGMAKALNLAYENLEINENIIQERKEQLIKQLQDEFECVSFNGSALNSMSTVVNAQFDVEMDPGMLLFQLDLKGVCVSGGSACSSGSLKGSHVLSAVNPDNEMPSIRFSICRNTSAQEIDYVVDCLMEILGK
ncbi:MAG: cysteine desulfurase [Glaciecola sp.]|jgi:cysteine desulfurase